MKQKWLKALGYLLLALTTVICTWTFCLGVQILATFLITKFDGVKTRGTVLMREDGVRCTFNRFAGDACSAVVTTYTVGTGETFVLKDKVYTSALTERNIAITYSSHFPTVAYFEGNGDEMTFWMFSYVLVSPLIFRLIYIDLNRLYLHHTKKKELDSIAER